MLGVLEDQSRIRETVLALSDDELLEMVTSLPEDYTPYALEVARQEIARRGGRDALQQRVSQETSREASATATAEVESRPWKGIFYGLVLVLGGIVIVTTTAKTPATRLIAWFGILLGGVQLLKSLVHAFWLRPSGTYIDPSDPLWQDAAHQARESIPTLRSLAERHLGDVMVKFPFVTDSGERELVWGKLRAMTDSSIRVTIETSPLTHTGKLPEEIEIPLTELLDWHLKLPDGTIRGSFTMQAEIILRERLGLRPAKGTAGKAGKFVDRLQAASGQ